MTLLLDALEIHGSIRRMLMAFGILSGVILALIGFASAEALAERQAGLGEGTPIVLVGVVWALWTFWHSHLFGHHRHRLLARTHPYREAFFQDIIPGATICVSQMLRPALNGDNLAHGTLRPAMPSSMDSFIIFALGLLVCAGALLLFVSALRVLGAARVLDRKSVV